MTTLRLGKLGKYNPDAFYTVAGLAKELRLAGLGIGLNIITDLWIKPGKLWAIRVAGTGKGRLLIPKNQLPVARLLASQYREGKRRREG